MEKKNRFRSRAIASTALLLATLLALICLSGCGDTTLDIRVEPTVAPTQAVSRVDNDVHDAKHVKADIGDAGLPAVDLPAKVDEPAATATPIVEETHPSEIITLDETWNRYTNYDLGFSLKVPKTEEGLGTYTNDEYGFSLRYPQSWTLSELPEREMDTGKCADTLVLSQGTLAITIQVLHTSQCCEQVAWCGVAWIIEPTHRDKVMMMDQEADRTSLIHRDAVKAVDVSYIDEDDDLGLLITIRDTSDTAYTAPEMKALPASAVTDLDQILSSFERFE